MPAINPTRQEWLTQLHRQLQSGKWGQVVQTFFDEPLDPANEHPWEPAAIVRRNEGGNTIYIVLAEELWSDASSIQWREWSRHSTQQDAMQAVVRLRPWAFR